MGPVPNRKRVEPTLTRRKAIRPMKGRGRRPQRDTGHRMNKEINAPEVRLIDDEGNMVGIMPPSEALQMAENKGLDLIEIAPKAKPPTCKIMDYGKWKYENKKKEKEAKKRQTVVNVKEVQLRPRTEEHDLNVKLRHAEKFLLEGDKVKVNLRFTGREMAHQELGLEMLNDVIARLDEIAQVEQAPKKEGRQMFAMLVPDNAKIKEYKKKKAKEEKAEGEPAEPS